MIYVNVTYKLPKENREAFVADILEQKIPELTKAERGNHAYDFSIPIDNEEQVYLREIWDDDAFEEHKAGENIKKMGAMKDKYDIETEIVISHA